MSSNLFQREQTASFWLHMTATISVLGIDNIF